MAKKMTGCFISEDAFETFNDIYGPLLRRHGWREEVLHEELSTILSTPPFFSTLRVNLLKSNICNANQFLETTIGRQNTERCLKLKVAKHGCIPDVLLVCSPEQPKHIEPVSTDVIVDELCGMAALRGADVFVPGILGSFPYMNKGDLVSVYADLDGICRKGYTKCFEGRKYFVGNGVALLSRSEIFKESQPRGTAIRMDQPLYANPSFNDLNGEIFFAQNLPSLLVAHNLSPKPGDIILDMCAAPGGKSTHAAILMENEGTVVAVDKSKSKVKKMKLLCKKQDLSCIECIAFDSTKLCSTNKGQMDESNRPPFDPETFDKIILDPPCSALGQRPQLQCKLTAANLESYPVYQKKLLKQVGDLFTGLQEIIAFATEDCVFITIAIAHEHLCQTDPYWPQEVETDQHDQDTAYYQLKSRTEAVNLLKPGGILMYSTCTLTISENENQVAWTLKNFPQLKLVPQNLHLGRHGIKGHGLSDENCVLVQRFDPFLSKIEKLKAHEQLSSDEDTIGFFVAKFVKTA